MKNVLILVFAIIVVLLVLGAIGYLSMLLIFNIKNKKYASELQSLRDEINRKNNDIHGTTARISRLAKNQQQLADVAKTLIKLEEQIKLLTNQLIGDIHDGVSFAQNHKFINAHKTYKKVLLVKNDFDKYHEEFINKSKNIDHKLAKAQEVVSAANYNLDLAEKFLLENQKHLTNSYDFLMKLHHEFKERVANLNVKRTSASVEVISAETNDTLLRINQFIKAIQSYSNIEKSIVKSLPEEFNKFLIKYPNNEKLIKLQNNFANFSKNWIEHYYKDLIQKIKYYYFELYKIQFNEGIKLQIIDVCNKKIPALKNELKIINEKLNDLHKNKYINIDQYNLFIEQNNKLDHKLDDLIQSYRETNLYSNNFEILKSLTIEIKEFINQINFKVISNINNRNKRLYLQNTYDSTQNLYLYAIAKSDLLENTIDNENSINELMTLNSTIQEMFKSDHFDQKLWNYYSEHLFKMYKLIMTQDLYKNMSKTIIKQIEDSTTRNFSEVNEFIKSIKQKMYQKRYKNAFETLITNRF